MAEHKNSAPLLRKICHLYATQHYHEASGLIIKALSGKTMSESSGLRWQAEKLCRVHYTDEEKIPFIEVCEAFEALDTCFRHEDELMYEEVFFAQQKIREIKKHMNKDDWLLLEKDRKFLKDQLQILPHPKQRANPDQPKFCPIGESHLEKKFKSEVRLFYLHKDNPTRKEDFKKIRKMAYVLSNIMLKKIEDSSVWYGDKVKCMEQYIATVNWQDLNRTQKFKAKAGMYEKMAQLHLLYKNYAAAGNAEIMRRRFEVSVKNIAQRMASRYESYNER